MNGVSLKQQDVVARAARKEGGYWKLIQKLASAQNSNSTPRRKVKMTLERDDETGELRVVQVTNAA